MSKDKKSRFSRIPYKRVSIDLSKGGRTKQAHKDDCDIDKILRKYATTGVITHKAQYGGKYDDFVGFEDYQSCMNKVIAAQDMFNTLPANIRNRFNNDPARS